MINKIVDFMVKTGTRETTTGSYCMEYSEIAKVLCVDMNYIRENHENIIVELDSREEILDATWDIYDNNGKTCGFDMNFCLSACEDWDGSEEWGCLM